MLWPNQAGAAANVVPTLHLRALLQTLRQKDQVVLSHPYAALHQHICVRTKVHSPLQVLHGYRTMFNVRNGQDLAQFLADPQREEFDSHSSHLSRIQVQRTSSHSMSRLHTNLLWKI